MGMGYGIKAKGWIYTSFFIFFSCMMVLFDSESNQKFGDVYTQSSSLVHTSICISNLT
jgi:hypothetical protein